MAVIHDVKSQCMDPSDQWQYFQERYFPATTEVMDGKMKSNLWFTFPCVLQCMVIRIPREQRQEETMLSICTFRSPGDTCVGPAPTLHLSHITDSATFTVASY